MCCFDVAEPIKVIEPLKDTIVKERETITLECKISKARVKCVWLKDGKPLKAVLRTETKHDGQLHRLTINKAELADIGKYSVSFDDDDCVLEANVDIKGLLRLNQIQLGYLFSPTMLSLSWLWSCNNISAISVV